MVGGDLPQRHHSLWGNHDPLLVEQGRFREDELVALLRSGKYPARNPVQNIGDLKAQIAACELGRRRYLALVQKYGLDLVQGCIETIWNQCEAIARERVLGGIQLLLRL